MKADIIRAVKTMNPSNFYIFESLSPQSQTFCYVLRRPRKDFDQIISGSITVDGINYVWVEPPNAHVPGAKNVRHKISTHSALSPFCSQTLRRPLTHYLPERKYWLSFYCQKVIINHAAYYIVSANLYIAFISMFNYLIACHPDAASHHASVPQFALLTTFPLPLHKTVVCYANADKTC